MVGTSTVPASLLACSLPVLLSTEPSRRMPLAKAACLHLGAEHLECLRRGYLVEAAVLAESLVAPLPPP